MARGDGGTLRIQQRSGPFRITVFSAPEPLRAGAADFSVLVQRHSDDGPVLGAEVALRVDGPAPVPPIETRATRDAATNKLLHAARVELPVPGDWTLRVSVRDGGDEGVATGSFAVAPRAPPLRALWPFLALPPVAVLLFAIREWRARSRAPRSR